MQSSYSRLIVKPQLNFIILEWLCQKKMQKVSLIISNSVTKEVLERWDFKVQYEGDRNAAESGKTVGNKDLTLIQKEIRSVLRQISGTVSFLPLLDCLCKYEAWYIRGSVCKTFRPKISWFISGSSPISSHHFHYFHNIYLVGMEWTVVFWL